MRALARIRVRFPGPQTIYSPLAEGADRLVARCALADSAAELVVPLPLPEDEYLRDFTSAASRGEFLALRARAREVVTLRPAATREAAYEAVGDWILDRVDVLIAVWDEKMPQGQGGTGAIVSKARRRGTPIAWVHAGNRDETTQAPTTLPTQGEVTFAGGLANEHPDRPRLVLHVGVTGHRHEDLAGCDLDAVRVSVADLLARVGDQVTRIAERHHGEFVPEAPLRRFFSRLADGADILAAEEAVRQGWELHCPLPFSRDAYAAHVAEPWRDAYRALLARATTVLELDGDAAAPPLAEAFFESRRTVLRHCDVLIAIWDPANRPSGVWGTTRLVDEARHDDLLVIHVPPRAPTVPHLDVGAEDADIHQVGLEQLESRLTDLLAPPGTGLDAAMAATPARQRPLASLHEAFFTERQRRWTPGFVWPLLSKLMVGEKRLGLRVADVQRATAEEWSTGWRTAPRLPVEVRTRIDAVLREPFGWADQLSVYYANLTRSSLVLNYLMAALAVFFALLAYGLSWTDHGHPRHHWAWLWTAVELALILAIVANTRLGNRWRWHERWIDYRALAERIRLQRVLAPLARVAPHTSRPAHLSFGDVRGSWLAWYHRALVRQLGMVPIRFDADYVMAARMVVAGMLADRRVGQISYHYRTAQTFHAIERRLHRAGLGLFVATAVACAAHLVWHSPWLTVVCAAFPALGAALEAIAVHAQLERVGKHSRAMFEGQMGLVQFLARQPALSRHLGPPCEAIAESMTSEVLDWRSLYSGRLRLPA